MKRHSLEISFYEGLIDRWGKVLNIFDKAILTLTLDGKKPKEMLALNPNLKDKFGDDNKKLSDFRRESYWHLYKVLQECERLEEQEICKRILYKLTLGVPKFVSTEDFVSKEEEENFSDE